MEFETVDLDDQDVRDAQGRRVTQDTVDQLVAAVEKAKGGRPSLTGPGKHSPSVTLRLPEPVDARLAERAQARGLTKSQAVREAIDRWLDDAA
jgi:hypothetical protein